MGLFYGVSCIVLINPSLLHGKGEDGSCFFYFSFCGCVVTRGAQFSIKRDGVERIFLFASKLADVTLWMGKDKNWRSVSAFFFFCV
jgi:hypothetical protein